MSETDSMVNRVVWVDIPVVNLDRAQAFYSSVLDIEVFKQEYEGIAFCVLAHSNGSGGCLVVKPDEVGKGILVYFNVNGRIRDAVEKVKGQGGKIEEPIHSIGPHGCRALVADSEGNSIALHSEVDQ